jgi:hypothetical protein
MKWARKYIGGIAYFYHAPRIHQGNAVGECRTESGIVSDDDNRSTVSFA